MTWDIVLTSAARKALLKIKDRRIRAGLVERIDALADDPEKQGKTLMGELKGYRSVRAVGQRYRVIYKIEDARVVVIVVALGLRKDSDKKDVYALAQKMIKLGLLEED